MTDQANRPVAEITGDLDQLCIDTIRTLSMDAVQAANSGHPGTPMALAPVAYWIYDNNHITIEGPTSLAFSEDVATRYQSSGWNVTRVGDANDLDMLSRAFDTFKAKAKLGFEPGHVIEAAKDQLARWRRE